MRTKEEILDDVEKEEVTFYKQLIEVLIDIRDVMADDNIYIEEIAKTLEEMAEPIKYIANQDGGNF